MKITSLVLTKWTMENLNDIITLATLNWVLLPSLMKVKDLKKLNSFIK